MTLSLIEEAPELIALAQQGNTHAFSRLIEAEQTRLLAQALVFCGDVHLAQDLVQETLLAAWKNFHRFDGSCRLFTWLYVILLRQHRRSLGWLARRLPRATAQQQEAAARGVVPTTWEDNPRSREADLLRSMVRSLPARHREVIELHFYAEASEEETATALGIAPGTVKSRLHHALKKLRRMKEKVNGLQQASH